MKSLTLLIIFLALVFGLGYKSKIDNKEQALIRIEQKLEELNKEFKEFKKMAWNYIATYQDSGD
jgi:Tfp pilus assembly protein PilO